MFGTRQRVVAAPAGTVIGFALVAVFTLLPVVGPGAVAAQEPEDGPAADPAHYTVVFENGQVRVVRIRYGPGERSPMHSHAPGVYVFLTDGHALFTRPDGTSRDADWLARGVEWDDRYSHAVRNLEDSRFEAIVVEPKASAGSDPAVGRLNEAAAREVRAAVEAYDEAVRSLDVDAIASSWTADGAALGAGFRMNGREAIRRAMVEGGYPRSRVHDLTIHSRELEVRGDLAVEVTSYTETISTDGGEPRSTDGNYLAQWKRLPDGSWKIHRMVFATAPSPSGAAGT